MAIDKVVSASITDSAVTSTKVAAGVLHPNFKNLFINGDMSIAQRGTTSSSTGYQTVDRWRLNTGTQQEQKTDTPDARFSNSFEATGTVSGSSGYAVVYQRIESKNVLPALGQTCTLSMYVKNTGTSTANVTVEVYRANSTDNFSGLTLVAALGNQAITTSWNRITFPSFTVTDASATGLEVRIFRYDASNDQEWLMTGCQLEVGSSASDFEFLPHDVNLKRCQRYFYKIESTGTTSNNNITTGFTYGTSGVQSNVKMEVLMRSTPSFSYDIGTNGLVLYNNSDSVTASVPKIYAFAPFGGLLYFDSDLSGTFGATYRPVNVSFNTSPTQTKVLKFDAEL